MTKWIPRALPALVVFAAFAGHEQNVSSGMTLAGAPLAIHGYDAVAFHSEGDATLGSAQHTAVYGGAAYRFTSEANKLRFEGQPERYLPRFGGYCAFGVSVGAKFDGDPRLFQIVDDQLYFNLNPDIQKTWREDIPGNIEKADAHWKRIQHKAPAELK